MNSIFYPFQFPLYQNFIDNSSFELIKKDVYLYITNNKNKFQESWGCTTKTTFYEKQSPFQSDILEKQIQTHTENYFKTWGFHIQGILKISNYWINLADQNDFQESHHHMDSQTLTNIFSGVLYIDVPKNSGNLFLSNPNSFIDLFPPNETSPPSYKITPKQKQIILFPSWLKHGVETNKSNNSRISLSWNVKIVK